MHKFRYTGHTFAVPGIGTLYRCTVVKMIPWYGFGDVSVQRWTVLITKEQYNRFRDREYITEQEAQEIGIPIGETKQMIRKTVKDHMRNIKGIEQNLFDDLLPVYRDPILKFLLRYRNYNIYRSIEDLEIVGVTESSIRVRFTLTRRDPLFDDFEATVDIPIDYLEAPSHDDWIESKEVQDELEKKAKRVKEVQEEIIRLEEERGRINKKVKELLNEVAD